MIPSEKEVFEELEIAGVMNPGPWVVDSKNVGLAAKNIAHYIPELAGMKLQEYA